MLALQDSKINMGKIIGADNRPRYDKHGTHQFGILRLDFGRLVVEMWHGGIMKTGGKLITCKSLSSNFKVNFTTLNLQ